MSVRFKPRPMGNCCAGYARYMRLALRAGLPGLMPGGAEVGGIILFRAARASYDESWMKALLPIFLALVLGVALAGAKPLNSGEDEADGWLEDGTYTNRVYSFEFKIPAGWQVAS